MRCCCWKTSAPHFVAILNFVRRISFRQFCVRLRRVHTILLDAKWFAIYENDHLNRRTVFIFWKNYYKLKRTIKKRCQGNYLACIGDVDREGLRWVCVCVRTFCFQLSVVIIVKWNRRTQNGSGDQTATTESRVSVNEKWIAVYHLQWIQATIIMLRARDCVCVWAQICR